MRRSIARGVWYWNGSRTPILQVRGGSWRSCWPTNLNLSWGLSKAQERVDMHEPDKLRELASWYREFAERAGNPTIWEGRLRMAEDLDKEAERIERNLAADSVERLER